MQTTREHSRPAATTEQSRQRRGEGTGRGRGRVVEEEEERGWSDLLWFDS
jgi:hypothetical protein